MYRKSNSNAIETMQRFSCLEVFSLFRFSKLDDWEKNRRYNFYTELERVNTGFQWMESTQTQKQHYIKGRCLQISE